MFELASLPLEIQEIIFNKCESAHLRKLACTSSHFNHALKEILWRNLFIRWNSLLNVDWRDEGDRRRLNNLMYTKKLVFGYIIWRLARLKNPVKLVKAFANIVSRCDPDRVRILHMRGRQIHGSISYACEVLTKLKEVDFTGATGFTDGAVLKSLSQLSSLEVLNLSRTDIEDEQLILIANNLKKLQKLVLNDLGHYLSGKSLSLCVTNLTKLKVLCLQYVDSVDDGLLLLIANKLPLLQRLDVRGTAITEKGVESISKLKHLNYLDLSDCTLLSGLEMSYVASLSMLQTLDISMTTVTNKGIWYLSSLVHLHELVMCDCYLVTDISCSYIQNMHSLQLLDISGNFITNMGVQALMELKKLKTLKCWQTEITYEAIEPLLERMTVEWVEPDLK